MQNQSAKNQKKEKKGKKCKTIVGGAECLHVEKLCPAGQKLVFIYIGIPNTLDQKCFFWHFPRFGLIKYNSSAPCTQQPSTHQPPINVIHASILPLPAPSQAPATPSKAQGSDDDAAGRPPGIETGTRTAVDDVVTAAAQTRENDLSASGPRGVVGGPVQFPVPLRGAVVRRREESVRAIAGAARKWCRWSAEPRGYYVWGAVDIS